MKKQNKILSIVLSVFSLAICCSCTTSGYNGEGWVDRRTSATYTYNGKEWETHTVQFNGETYMKMPAHTEISQFIISCPFDEYNGKAGQDHLYTSTKDEGKNFLSSPYGVKGETPPKNFVDGYVKVGYQFPNIYEVEITAAYLWTESLDGGEIVTVEESVVTFDTPVLLVDIIDTENVVRAFDRRSAVYAVFDIKGQTCLRLGGFAVCEKDGALYLRLHAWEEKYYKIKDVYQDVFNDLLTQLQQSAEETSA